MRFEKRMPRWDDGYALAGLYFLPLLAVAVLLASRLPPSRLPLCGLKRLTGIPCPTCGAWRTCCALVSGSWADAWRCQPLLASAFFLLAGVSLYASVTAIGRWPRLFPILSHREFRALCWAVAVMVLVNWAYLVLDGR